jgi:phospholipase/carboxylesterase
LDGGGYCWFNLNYVDGKLVRDFKAVEQAGAQIETLIDAMVSKYKLKSGKAILCGFSQGAIMSYYLALHNPQKIRAIVALSGVVPPEFEVMITEKTDLSALPMFIGHGRNDSRLLFEEFEHAVRLFENRTSVTVYPFDGGHEIPNAEILACVKWLNEKVLK